MDKGDQAPGRGTQIWCDGRLPLEPRNPYPCLRDIFAEKGIGPFFTIFGIGCPHGEHPSFLKNGPMLRDIFVGNGAHVLGFLVKKRPIRAAHPRMS